MLYTHPPKNNNKQQMTIATLLSCSANKIYKGEHTRRLKSSVPKINPVVGCHFAFRKASRRTFDSIARSSTAFPPPREREEK